MKILVGYDGSNSGKEALDLAKHHAMVFKGEVDVVTSMVKGTEKEREDMDQAKRGLEYAEVLFKDNNIPCKTHLLIRGLTPGEDVVEFAKENHIDEIIVGVKRRSKVGKLLMGSTAQYVILNAHCPVVTVK
ncbi:MAG: universal stress protein [Thermodesulfobacteriota bacterium]|nr:universal stress protein [Thermodesulfobacteriota bacterium]